MIKNLSLRICLYEEHSHLFSHLSAILVLAGHSVSRCSKADYPLATFLQELADELKPPYIPYYDLIIIDVSETVLSAQIMALLGQLHREQSLPVILMAEADTPSFDLLRTHVPVVPVLFHTVLHIQELFAAIEVTMRRSFPLSSSVLREVRQQQREHFQATIQAEQAWLTTRRTWLSQREEWFTQRQQWLSQRMMWILQQRELPDAQLEWLDEQRDWLVQQQDEVKQQQRWVQHHRLWLDQRQHRLDKLLLQQPLADVG